MLLRVCTNTYILSCCSPGLLLKTISVSPSSPFSAASGPLDWLRSSSLCRCGLSLLNTKYNTAYTLTVLFAVAVAINE